MKSNPLTTFYSEFGYRGVMFLIFAVSVIIHSVMALNMQLLSIHPDEIGTAAIAALYTGHDWSGITEPVGFYYGYVQAVLYAPLMLIFDNPYALYKAMLVLNGVLISFIPLIAYHLAEKMGVPHVWQKLVIALACGFYTSYMAYSKFIWNESIASLLPWFLIWCVYMAWDRRENSSEKIVLSALVGFFCAFSYGAHPRLIAIVIALIVVVLIARFVMKEKLLNLPSFFVTMAVSFVAEYFACSMIKQRLWGDTAINNTPEAEFDRITGLAEPEGVQRLFSTLFGHIYSFFSSTAGLGALAIVLLFIVCYQNHQQHKRLHSEDNDNTEIYEKPLFSHRLVFIGLYAFFAVGGSMLLSVLFKFNSDKIGSIKDLTIFARYTENAAPLAIFFVLAVIFLHGYTWRNVLCAAAIYAMSCITFGVFSYPVIESAGSYRELSVISLLPLRFSEDITKPFTEMSFLIISSVVFTVLALLIVSAACTRRFKSQFAAGWICAVYVYTTMFVGVVYLPIRHAQSAENIKAAESVSQLIYNDSLSPDVITVGVSSRISSLIQFLNPDTTVIINNDKPLPENCIVIATNSVRLSDSYQDCMIIGTAGKYSVYAYGEKAQEYIKYRLPEPFAAEEASTEEQNVQ